MFGWANCSQRKTLIKLVIKSHLQWYNLINKTLTATIRINTNLFAPHSIIYKLESYSKRKSKWSMYWKPNAKIIRDNLMTTIIKIRKVKRKKSNLTTLPTIIKMS